LGEIASRRSLELLASFATTGIQTYIANDPRKEELFIEQLQAAVMETHATILSEAQRAGSKMKTTITMIMTRWPVGYVVQVGDSRCYLLREGKLMQVTRDQTLAQYVIDAGVENADTIKAAWGNVLSSSVGGKYITPAITKIDVHWDDRFLLCTDGLTAHLTDEKIRDLLAASGSAREACEALVDEALEAGGTDNVTVVIGSPRRPTP
jgi:protein phosphatase